MRMDTYHLASAIGAASPAAVATEEEMKLAASKLRSTINLARATLTVSQSVDDSVKLQLGTELSEHEAKISVVESKIPTAVADRSGNAVKAWAGELHQLSIGISDTTKKIPGGAGLASAIIDVGSSLKDSVIGSIPKALGAVGIAAAAIVGWFLFSKRGKK